MKQRFFFARLSSIDQLVNAIRPPQGTATSRAASPSSRKLSTTRLSASDHFALFVVAFCAVLMRSKQEAPVHSCVEMKSSPHLLLFYCERALDQNRSEGHARLLALRGSPRRPETRAAERRGRLVASQCRFLSRLSRYFGTFCEVFNHTSGVTRDPRCQRSDESRGTERGD